MDGGGGVGVGGREGARFARGRSKGAHLIWCWRSGGSWPACGPWKDWSAGGWLATRPCGTLTLASGSRAARPDCLWRSSSSPSPARSARASPPTATCGA